MTDLDVMRQQLAPTGCLRAAINLGNPILARRDAQGRPAGVSVDLAQQLAQALGVPLEPVVVDAAGLSVQAVEDERADVGFFAIDPRRAQKIAFTAPYVLIEGSYLVHDASPLRDNAEVDRDGHTVVVGAGSAYDLHLNRALRHAQIVRAPTSPTVVDTFLANQADTFTWVAAGVRQQLEADAQRHGGLRLLPGRFMVIRQAMGCPSSRGAEAATALARFVDAARREGRVAAALARHGIDGATVAGPGD